MMSSDHDLVVVGGGSAGHAAARTAAGLGADVALVESAETLGGLCILRGCMPSKTLIETANRMRAIREAGNFGIDAPEPRLDADRLRSRLERLVGGFREARVGAMRSTGYRLVRGAARFRSPHQIEVRDRDGSGSLLGARAFVVATGSHPHVPGIPGLRDTPYWTSDDVVALPRVPERLLVVGSGAVGMECAHLFEGLGSRVTVLARSERILGGFDADLAEAVQRAGEERGIRVLACTEAGAVRHADGRFRVSTGEDGTEHEADALLVATGRRPRLDGLGLDAAGVALASGRIVIDERAATSVPHIFAAGDCASPVPVVHLAVRQGEVAARNALRLLRGTHTDPPAEWQEQQAMVGLFTAPEVVKVGMSLDEARRHGLEAREFRHDLDDQGKGEIVGSRHGFAKLVVEDGSRRLLGAAAVGPGMIDCSHVIQLALRREMSLDELLETPFYHPTLAEIWSYVAESDL